MGRKKIPIELQKKAVCGRMYPANIARVMQQFKSIQEFLDFAAEHLEIIKSIAKSKKKPK